MIKPNGDRVFIKKIDRVTQTDSGIYLGIDPAKAQIENMGVIVAVGNDIKYKEGCKVGVRVAFDSILEMDIEIEEDTYVILRENNIQCYFYDGIEEEQ